MYKKIIEDKALIKCRLCMGIGCTPIKIFDNEINNDTDDLYKVCVVCNGNGYIKTNTNMSKYLTHKLTGIIVPIDHLTQGVDEVLLCIADGAEDWFIYKDKQYKLHYDHSFENLGAYIRTKKNFWTKDTTYLHQLDQETLNKLVII